jgi:DNA ligase (NAD+)
LHNLHIGDFVYVEKGGEIIPKIVGVDTTKRPTDAKEIKFITECPECDTKLIRKEGEAKHFCPNELSCPPQIKGKIEHFISRKAMNINGGEATIDLLLKAGLINNIADLYHLKKEDLLTLERFAEKSADNLLASINESKKVPFPRVLFALGIRFVGETVAKVLAKHSKSIEQLQNMNFDELIEIEEIGDKIADSILLYFNEQSNLKLINSLKESGLQFEIEESDSIKGNQLEGLSIIISGSFKNHSRDEIKALIEAHGGKNTSSISKKTDYLIAGDKIGPSKLAKAEKLGLKIISETEFEAMIQ